LTILVLGLFVAAGASGCSASPAAGSLAIATTSHVTPVVLPRRSTPVPLTATAVAAPETPTYVPTATLAPPTPVPTPTRTPTPIPSPTQAADCSRRIPADDLLTLVTMAYGLSRDYEPADLVSLADYLPQVVTLGYPTKLRQEAVAPLVEMVEAMLAAGLRPTIISGYRSYAAQAIAWNKWLEKEPERVSILSAPPGHSEHQLGTTVDFGTPELAEMLADPAVEFHTYFYKTAVGEWLAAHAHEYGFALSYPREAQELTGFFYEPWHFRYVGRDLAASLHVQGITLTQYLLDRFPPPCPA
jgi:D-alanyl-D-alanine carboxypeptidase